MFFRPHFKMTWFYKNSESQSLDDIVSSSMIWHYSDCNLLPCDFCQLPRDTARSILFLNYLLSVISNPCFTSRVFFWEIQSLIIRLAVTHDNISRLPSLSADLWRRQIHDHKAITWFQLSSFTMIQILAAPEFMNWTNLCPQSKTWASKFDSNSQSQIQSLIESRRFFFHLGQNQLNEKASNFQWTLLSINVSVGTTLLRQ